MEISKIPSLWHSSCCQLQTGKRYKVPRAPASCIHFGAQIRFPTENNAKKSTARCPHHNCSFSVTLPWCRFVSTLGYFINIHIMYVLDKVDLRVYVNLECYIGTHIKTEHLWAVGMGLYVHLLRKVRQEDCELEVSLDSKSPVTWAEETAQWAEHWLWSWAEEIKHWLCDHWGL